VTVLKKAVLAVPAAMVLAVAAPSTASAAEPAAPCTTSTYPGPGVVAHCTSGYWEVGAAASLYNGPSAGQSLCYPASVPGNQECIVHITMVNAGTHGVGVVDGVYIYSTNSTVYGGGGVSLSPTCIGVFTNVVSGITVCP
jgi:hypothetical protein